MYCFVAQAAGIVCKAVVFHSVDMVLIHHDVSSCDSDINQFAVLSMIILDFFAAPGPAISNSLPELEILCF